MFELYYKVNCGSEEGYQWVLEGTFETYDLADQRKFEMETQGVANSELKILHVPEYSLSR